MKYRKRTKKSKLLLALSGSATFFVVSLIFATLITPVSASVKTPNSKGTYASSYQFTTPSKKVPGNLNEAHNLLLQTLPKNVVAKMKKGNQEDMADYYATLGRQIRNEWGLKNGSRLAKYFNKLGITQPDDMYEIVLDTFWEKLNNKPIALNEKVKYYQDYWASINKQQKDNKPAGTFNVSDNGPILYPGQN